MIIIQNDGSNKKIVFGKTNENQIIFKPEKPTSEPGSGPMMLSNFNIQELIDLLDI